MKKAILLLTTIANAETVVNSVNSHADNFKGKTTNACEGEEKCH